MSNTPSRYLALLRGINVGGKNVISKDELRACFEDIGCSNVLTYIQSGNILFRATETNIGRLTSVVEEALSNRFSYDASAVILSHRKYKSAIQAAPAAWGNNDTQKHNALFVMRGITPKQILAKLPERKLEIEDATAGAGVIFWSISKANATRATLMRLPTSPLYQQLTVRNHNTVFKLLQLFDKI